MQAAEIQIVAPGREKLRFWSGLRKTGREKDQE